MLKYLNLSTKGFGMTVLLSSLTFALVSSADLGAQTRTEDAIFGKPGAYGIAGCGLGTVIWGKKRGQLFAATSNLYSGQAFSITLGISNCDAKSPDSAYLQKSREAFVAVNYGFLELEMASGQGKRLESFAGLMGCPMDSVFANMAQKNHLHFFGVSQSKPGKFVERVQNKIKSDAALSASCKIQA